MAYPGWQIERAIRAAAFYRRVGLSPIASDPRVNHAPYPHAHLRDHGQSPEDFASRNLPAIQLATGSRPDRPGLIVVDLDGPIAREVWGDLARFRERPATWETNTPSGGRHIYYTVPAGHPPVPWRICWRLRDGNLDEKGRPTHVKHELIEILGEGRLAFAPPSFKFKDGKTVPYRWAPGLGPRDLPRPAPCPAWVLALPSVEGGGAATRTPAPPRSADRARVPGHHDRDEVLAAIPVHERIRLARDWGVRVVHENANPAGFIPCRAIDRDDSNPSASFHPHGGFYVERGRVALSLFDLAVERGVYASFHDACNALGNLYLSSPDRRRPA